MTDETPELTLKIYEAFASNNVDGWDGLVDPEVKVNSPAGRDIVGLDAMKDFGRAFHAAFRPRIDLIDHYVAGDRAFVMINLHWKHDGEPFYGLPATGKGGTSIEVFMLRLKDGVVTHWDVADHTLDLANYLYESGMDLPKNIAPPALVEGLVASDSGK